MLHFQSLSEVCAVSDSSSGLEYLGDTVSGRLVLDTSQTGTKYGTFKRAQAGTLTTDESVFPGTGADFHGVSVCVKQAYYRNPNDTVTVHTGMEQAKQLLSEIQCLVWARTLLDDVYAFVDANIPRLGLDVATARIPHMKFVEASLATSGDAVSTSTHHMQSYLIEHQISPSVQVSTGREVRWRKYINNDSPAILAQFDTTANDRAAFLAFSQHVQLVQTEGMAFVTDYQGE